MFNLTSQISRTTCGVSTASSWVKPPRFAERSRVLRLSRQKVKFQLKLFMFAESICMRRQCGDMWQNVRETREKLWSGNVPRPAWVIWLKLSWYLRWARQQNFNTFLSRMALRARNWTWGRTLAPRTWGLKWSTTQWYAMIFRRPFGLGCVWMMCFKR